MGIVRCGQSCVRGEHFKTDFMNITYTINGWDITAQTETVTARSNGKTWKQESRAARFAGVDYFIAEFIPEFWRDDRWRPYEQRCWLLMNEDGKVLAVGASQHEVIAEVH